VCCPGDFFSSAKYDSMAKLFSKKHQPWTNSGTGFESFFRAKFIEMASLLFLSAIPTGNLCNPVAESSL
jgi:hypothetical protein